MHIQEISPNSRLQRNVCVYTAIIITVYLRYIQTHFFAGGYWGIFLGYALVALPQLIGRWRKTLRKVFAKRKTREITQEKEANVYKI